MVRTLTCTIVKNFGVNCCVNNAYLLSKVKKTPVATEDAEEDVEDAADDDQLSQGRNGRRWRFRRHIGRG